MTGGLRQSTIPVTHLAREPWPAYVLDRCGQIVYANPAWDRIAEQSSGPLAREVIGTRWLDYVRAPELAAWYRDLFARVMHAGQRGERHEGDCNTPDRHRIFSVRYDPLTESGVGEPTGLLVLTSLLVDTPIGDDYVVGHANDGRYRTSDGLILQCGGCRRVHVASTVPRVWEFVPEYVAKRRGDVTHGLCELCREVHYGFLQKRAS